MRAPGSAKGVAVSAGVLFTRRRMELLGRFASVQVLVQALAFASGIALVNFLQTEAYGHYTLAVNLVALGMAMVDLGLATAVLATGGPVHGQREALRNLLADATRLQRWMLPCGACLLLPAVTLMLHRQGLSGVGLAITVLLVGGCVAFGVRSAALLSIVRLRGSVSLQQRLELGIGLGRLLLILGAAAIYLDAQVALSFTLLASMATVLVVRRHVARDIGEGAEATGTFDAPLKAFVRRQAPNTLYYAFSGQIALWLVGMLGTVDRVAEVGALGRLGALFTVLGAVVAVLVQPHFARQSLRRDFVRALASVNVLYAALTVLLVGTALLVPTGLLWMLGPRYGGLSTELPWMAAASAFSAWAAALYAIGASRGWLLPAWIVIPLGCAVIALSIASLDLATVRGAFMMNSAIALAGLLMTLGLLWARLSAAGEHLVNAT